MFVQNIYVFFSKSTKRWDILNSHLESHLQKRREKDPKARKLVPKRLSDTRWSARNDACQALKAGYSAFPAALMEIFNYPDEKKVTQVEAETLCKDFYKMETAILLEFWCNILHKANGVSKSLQNPELDIRTTVSLYRSISSSVKNMRSEKSFCDLEEKCKTLIRGCPDWENKNDELIYNCYNKRKPKRNTRNDIGNCAETFFDDSTKFRVKIFYATLDTVATELQLRADSYEKVLQPFNFLFHLDTGTDDDIRDGAANLTEVYSTDLGEDFVEECIHFKCFMDDIKREMDKECEHYYIDSESDGETTNESDTHRKKRVSKPAKMLQYIKKYKIEPTFPNLKVALRIFECFAVANCSGERSFSALKRVKSFYRSTVKEKKLNATSVLYIENDVLNEIDIDLVIDQFVDSKARKRFI